MRATLLMALMGAVCSPYALAQTVVSTVQQQQTQTSAAQQHSTKLEASDVLLAKLWGLTTEELQRAKLLMQGPRAAFSVPTLSPIEALGLHARSDAERRKYAEMFARAVQDDVQRSLAFNSAFDEAMARLYGRQPVVDFSRLPRVVAPVGAADAANVPRSLVVDRSGSAIANEPADAVRR
jgi:hypothetical protein